MLVELTLEERGMISVALAQTEKELRSNLPEGTKAADVLLSSAEKYRALRARLLSQ